MLPTLAAGAKRLLVGADIDPVLAVGEPRDVKLVDLPRLYRGT